MTISFLSGFALGFSLIFALGAQNIFVLRQGLIKQHVLITALFCSISDSFLILVGVGGFGFLFGENFEIIKPYLFLCGGIWLALYGLIRIKGAVKKAQFSSERVAEGNTLVSLLVTLTILTYANPHVYLDTVILVGAVSMQYNADLKDYFALGAISASFIFFFSLSFGARFLSPLMKSQKAWLIFDTFSGVLMLFLSFVMFRSSGYL